MNTASGPRQPGELVEDADSWKNPEIYISSGHLSWVPEYLRKFAKQYTEQMLKKREAATEAAKSKAEGE